MAGGMLNLSLLSRGVGEVHTNGHEKVDVYLEPEDYLNFSTNSDKLCLPPIQPKYPLTYSDNSTNQTSREVHKFRVPKTYSTRKGALLLFSEDLAQRYTDAGMGVSDTHGANITVNGLHSQVCLNTVEDLANSILKYGSQGHLNDNIYLKFVRAHCGTFERQFRPGFSAKRYLSTWTRTWDDSVFGNIIKNGYLAEQSLYQHNLAVPNLRRRLVFDDLSRIPEPYKLMRNMLMTPDSLSGYTFYCQPSQEFEDGEDQSQNTDIVVLKKKSDKLQNIKVIKTKGTVQQEVFYSDLDHQSQKEVISDLLVKSAVHYAVKKQEEVYTDLIFRAMRSDQDEGFRVEDDEKVSSVIQEFDMREAVESLLDSQHGRLSSAPLNDDSRSSGGSVSFRGVAVSSHATRHAATNNNSWNVDGSDEETEYMGGAPPSPTSDSSESTKSLSVVPVLPPIRVVLSPIRDTSRETSQIISLPPLIQGTRFKDQPSSSSEPNTSHRQSLTGPTASSPVPGISDAQATRGLTSPDIDALSELGDDDAEVDEGGTSKRKDKIANAETISNFNSHQPANIDILKSTAGAMKAQATWKSSDWRKGAEGQSRVKKGSRIMAPDGEIINVGGSISRRDGWGIDVNNLTDVDGQQKNRGTNADQPDAGMSADQSAMAENSLEASRKQRILANFNGSKKSSLKEMASQGLKVTENYIMDMLTSHALQVAESVLSHPSAGTDLATDVKLAAELWSKMYPSRSLQPSSLVGEVGSGVIDQLSTSRPASSEASSVDEYKSLIRKSLTTAVTKAAGVEPDPFVEDAVISPQLLEALANHRMTPDQIEIVTDSEGHARIQTKEHQGDEKMGRQQISIPDGVVELEEENVVLGQDQDRSQEVMKATSKATDQKVTSPKVEKTHEGPDILPDNVPSAVRSSTTSGPQMSDTSKGSKKPGKTSDEKEDPFVVGMPKMKKKTTAQPPSQKEAKKVKNEKKEVKGKKKGVKKSLRQKTVKTKAEKLPIEKPQDTSEVQRQLSAKPEIPDISQSRMSSPCVKSEGSEPEFSFVRELSGSEDEEGEDEEPLTKLQVTSPDDDDEDKLDSESGDDGEASKLKSISNREARAAKRAAAAAKRREEVERRRKLKEEQLKREKEEMERQTELQKEMEEQRRRGEEDRRLRKQQKMEEDEREKMEAEEMERRQKLEVERERRAKEEFQRKLEEMKRKQQEEEMRKQELLLIKQKEEEERLAAEELMLSKMEKHERLEYERIKREEEDARRKKELEDKLRRALEAQAAMEEARRLTEEMSRKQAALEARLQFNRSLQDEASRLSQAHTINRAFVFSYFELLQWLGLDIPEFELAKLAE